jgi:nucleotide-binding universal stress UspA family protein
MTVVLARTRTAEGLAAARFAVEECRRRQEDPVTFRAPDPRNRDVVGELLDTVQAVDASAIVIGIRSRTAVGKLLLGSAAQQVLLEASVPVIAVKAVR